MLVRACACGQVAAAGKSALWIKTLWVGLPQIAAAVGEAGSVLHRQLRDDPASAAHGQEPADAERRVVAAHMALCARPALLLTG